LAIAFSLLEHKKNTSAIDRNYSSFIEATQRRNAACSRSTGPPGNNFMKYYTIAALVMLTVGVVGATEARSGSLLPTAHAFVKTRQVFDTADLPRKELSILTYNVEGLPWPIASDRPRALAQIGAELAAMHAAGTAPEIVVLQEAFTDEARSIAAQAGYPNIAFGPPSDTPRPEIPGFAPSRDLMKGEGLAPFVSSGLVILSDFPLHDVHRTPFPDGACSGYDCLANKGILSAQVQVPGVAQPVEVITTHMNSGNPSGMPEVVSRVAYAEELRALAGFTSQTGRPGTIRIYAGDFNVGHSQPRLALLMNYIRAQRARIATAMGREKRAGLCETSPKSCSDGLAIASNVPLVHANDWQFYSNGRNASVSPFARTAMFRPDAKGYQLSDHVGLEVVYRFE
jgi:endonuclease/exonuclease/phosphatase family metal-dependent hydrolase